MTDEEEVRRIFHDARVPIIDVVPQKHDAYLVLVPPQKNVTGRIKRLNDAMHEDRRFTLQYGVDVVNRHSYYWLKRST